MNAELLNAVVMALAQVVIVGLVVALVARYVSKRRSVSLEDSGPLPGDIILPWSTRLLAGRKE
jgi:hypothetical protein